MPNACGPMKLKPLERAYIVRFFKAVASAVWFLGELKVAIEL